MQVYGINITSRLLLGTAQYPSPAILADAIRTSRTEIVTVSLRREAGTNQHGQSSTHAQTDKTDLWRSTSPA